jgi:Tfp pilus assembly protein PilO
VQIKNRQQFLTILTIVAVSLLAIDKIISPPLLKIWDARSARIEKLRNDVRDGEVLRRGRDSIRGQWTKMQSGALPNNTTLAEQQLFTGLNYWSQLSGISLNSVTPQWKQGSDSTYKTLECRVEAVGSIDHLSHFLWYLEKDPMALKLQTVELASRDNDGTSIGLSVQVSGLVLTPKDQGK